MPDFSKETNCFQHFNFNSIGRNDKNQYLLSQLVRLSYPERLGSDLGTNRYVPDALFQEKFAERTFHWFYDQSKEPVEPKFNHRTWLALKNTCNANSLSSLEWILLGELYFEVSGEKPELHNPGPALVSNAAAIHDLNIREAARSIRTSTRSITSNNHTYLVSELNPSLSPIEIHGSNKNFIINKSEQIKSLVEKLSNTTLNCKQTVDNFLKAIDTYKNQLESYEKLKLDFNKQKPRFAYLTNVSSWRAIDDPECILISTNDYIIVVIRGTDGDHLRNDGVPRGQGSIQLSEWIFTNFFLDLRQGPPIKRGGRIIAPGRSIPGRVHNGMFRSLMSIDRQIVNFIRRNDGKNKKIWITGHSLGAAQSVLLASILINHDKIPVHSVYTFGAPRVGDNTFTSWFNAMFPAVNNQQRLQRFEFRYDPITCLPMHWVGYESFGIRNWYSDQKSSNEGMMYFFNRNERRLIYDNHSVQAVLNKCDHSPDHYCRQAYYLLQRNNQIEQNFPNLVPNPGTNTSYC